MHRRFEIRLIYNIVTWAKTLPVGVFCPRRMISMSHTDQTSTLILKYLRVPTGLAWSSRQDSPGRPDRTRLVDPTGLAWSTGQDSPGRPDRTRLVDRRGLAWSTRQDSPGRPDRTRLVDPTGLAWSTRQDSPGRPDRTRLVDRTTSARQL